MTHVDLIEKLLKYVIYDMGCVHGWVPSRNADTSFQIHTRWPELQEDRDAANTPGLVSFGFGLHTWGVEKGWPCVFRNIDTPVLPPSLWFAKTASRLHLDVDWGYRYVPPSQGHGKTVREGDAPLALVDRWNQSHIKSGWGIVLRCTCTKSSVCPPSCEWRLGLHGLGTNFPTKDASGIEIFQGTGLWGSWHDGCKRRKRKPENMCLTEDGEARATARGVTIMPCLR
jgi:hypothetical protein